MPEITREDIDALAAEIAPKRPCSCGGSRACGCWNLAIYLLSSADALGDHDTPAESQKDAPLSTGEQR